MELRNHPLMSYRGLSNWPPVWIWRGGNENKRARGEIGVLKDVFLSKIDPQSRVFLVVEHQAEEYVGCLLFSDQIFCLQIHALLTKCIDKTIADIGSLDVGHLA